MRKISVDWDRIITKKGTERARLQQEARLLLTETDWYVTRRAETGKEIPEHVAEARAEARRTLSS